MFDTKPIVQRLKSYLKENNLTQTTLAKRVGTSSATFSRWLNARTSFNPTLKQLLNMADIFGVSITELFSQEAAPAPKTPKTRGRPKKASSK